MWLKHLRFWCGTVRRRCHAWSESIWHCYLSILVRAAIVRVASVRLIMAATELCTLWSEREQEQKLQYYYLVTVVVLLLFIFDFFWLCNWHLITSRAICNKLKIISFTFLGSRNPKYNDQLFSVDSGVPDWLPIDDDNDPNSNVCFNVKWRPCIFSLRHIDDENGSSCVCYFTQANCEWNAIYENTSRNITIIHQHICHSCAMTYQMMFNWTSLQIQLCVYWTECEYYT